jgi:hypothetical protein
MTALSYLLAVLCGAVAAAAHARVVRARARAVVHGRSGVALATLPLSLAMPLVCFLPALLAGAGPALTALATFAVTGRALVWRSTRRT